MRMFSVIYLLGIAMSVYSEMCPSEEELHPCTCSVKSDSLHVSCNGYNTLALEEVKQPLKSLAGKVNVEIYLYNMVLGTVPSNFFKDIDVKKLDLLFCKLDSLSDGNQPILAGLENSLEVLDIQGSIKGDGDLSQWKFGHLIKLKELLLTDNNIKEVSNNWFDKGPASLHRIFLYRNGIEKLGNTAFADLSNLHNLLIRGNTLSPLERGMLPSSADKLYLLDLQNNNLENLPEDIFSDMPKLGQVNLESNMITGLDQDTWESVWEQLHSVNVKGNPLVCDSQMSWMFDMRGPAYIYGSCAAPTAKKGKSLTDFINDKEE